MTDWPPLEGSPYRGSGGDPEYPFRPEALKYAEASTTDAATLTNTSHLSLANVTGGTALSDEVEVTVPTGVAVIVFMYARIANDTAGSYTALNYEVSGATTVSASSKNRYAYESSNADDWIRAGSWDIRGGLTPGMNTFTLGGLVDAGTGTIDDPRIAVLAL